MKETYKMNFSQMYYFYTRKRVKIIFEFAMYLVGIRCTNDNLSSRLKEMQLQKFARTQYLSRSFGAPSLGTLPRKLRVTRRCDCENFHMHAVMAAVPIFIAATATSPTLSYLVLPRPPLLPPCPLPKPVLLLTAPLVRPSFVSAALLPAVILSQPRLVNIITPGFYFHDFFLRSTARTSVFLPPPPPRLLPFTTVAFSLSRCVKLLGNADEFARSLLFRHPRSRRYAPA